MFLRSHMNLNSSTKRNQMEFSSRFSEIQREISCHAVTVTVDCLTRILFIKSKQTPECYDEAVGPILFQSTFWYQTESYFD